MRRLLLSCLAVLGISAGCSRPPPDPVVEVAQQDVVTRGRLLVHGLAACGFCHGATPDPNAPLTGGRIFHDSFGAVTAANLTQNPDGLGAWSAQDFVRAMREGLRPDGSELSYEIHRGYEWMSDKDLIAIASYLRTVAPAGQQQERRELSFIDRNVKGFFLTRLDVPGLVPSISPSYGVEYGKYLADNVAHCATCHTTPGGGFSSSVYLAGGATITIGDQEKIAPGITGAAEGGIGNWNVNDIIHYLRTGIGADGHSIDPDFCPVKFYAFAEESELHAIAQFLKTVK